MTDLVERLRNRNTPYGWPELADKALDEIERLRTEIEHLRIEAGRLQLALLDCETRRILRAHTT